MKGGSIPRLLEICAIYVMCRNVNLFNFCLEPFLLFLFQDEKREIPAAARITVYLLIGLFGDSPVFLYYVTPLVGLTLSLGKYTPCDDRKKKGFRKFDSSAERASEPLERKKTVSY